MIMLNGKDSFWLQLEVCREYQRSRCTRSDGECKFAHPPTNVEVQSNGRVTACYDSIKVSLIFMVPLYGATTLNFGLIDQHNFCFSMFIIRAVASESPASTCIRPHTSKISC